MAQPLASMRRKATSVVCDRYGNVILSISVTDVLIRRPNNQTVRRRLNENIQLVCGTVYNPAMSVGQKPMLISVCECCRSPRTSLLDSHVPCHGLCSTEAGTHCHGCGEFLCPRHTVHGREGRPRCKRCSRHSQVRRLLRNMFFKVE